MRTRKEDFEKYLEAKHLYSIGECTSEVARICRIDKNTARKWRDMGIEPFVPSVARYSILDGKTDKYRMVAFNE